MEVIPTTVSPIFKVIIAKNNLLMHFGPKKQVHQQRMANTPYARFVASSNGKKIAVYSTKEKTGSMFVMDTNLDESPNKINEFFNSRPISTPAQMVWCGDKSVCMYWTTKQIAQSRPAEKKKSGEKTEEKKRRELFSYLVIVSPEFSKNVSYRYMFEGDIYLIPEVDGVRIITHQTCEFLSRVPGKSKLFIFANVIQIQRWKFLKLELSQLLLSYMTPTTNTKEKSQTRSKICEQFL
jgi:hypothetical protein